MRLRRHQHPRRPPRDICRHLADAALLLLALALLAVIYYAAVWLIVDAPHALRLPPSDLWPSTQ